jgi:hypothetical protein
MIEPKPLFPRHPDSMSLRTCITPCILFTVIGLTSCSKNKTPGYNPDIGPFDEDGNYIEAWADNPPNRETKLMRNEPAPRTTQAPKPVYKPTARPVYKPAPKPRPKPVAPKPKTIRHTVKKGDTLYNLARKYGTTISKIQKANGLTGSMIRTGKSYIIPR